MTVEELRSWLAARTDEECIDREILGRRPWIFPADEPYNAWRNSVASVLNVSTDGIRIVGSAATGFSLSPLKPGRPFRPLPSTTNASDIDVALVAPLLFTEAWNVVVEFDRNRRLGSTEDGRAKIRLDIYAGLVAHYSIPVNTDPARTALAALAVAGRQPPLRGHQIRCRIYRRNEDLRAYHIYSLRLLRQELAT